MSLTLAEALYISPLNRCIVIAGERGLARNIHSVNGFDAPDVISWLKPGELVLTTGYVFKNDETVLLQIIRELAKRQCAGLAIQIKQSMPAFSEKMIQVANDLDFPLIEIPEDLSLSNLVFPLIREILSYQDEKSDQFPQKAFLTQLLHGELRGEYAILARGRNFGLLSGRGYICIYIKEPSDIKSEITFTRTSLMEIMESIENDDDIDILTVDLEGSVIILQGFDPQESEKLHSFTLLFVQKLIDAFSLKFPKHQLTIGIGNHSPNVLEISTSFKNAKEALNLGRRLHAMSNYNVYYDYANLESYAILQHLPKDVIESYHSHLLAPLLQYDSRSRLDLLKTLEVYLACCGRAGETANILGVHRNTVNGRIAKIKELIGKNLDDGEVAFQLQMSLRIHHLMNTLPVTT